MHKSVPSLRFPALLLGIAALASVVAGCGGSSGGGTAVSATVNQSSLAATPASVKSGKTSFTVKNAGSENHEFAVIKTDTPQDKLTPGANGEVSEDGKVGEIEPFGANATKKLTLDLKPGNYVLLCNLPGHYQRGIHTGFTVQ